MKTFIVMLLVQCLAVAGACAQDAGKIIMGDERTDVYFPLLKDKRIAIFSNHTGMVGDKHLLDLLTENGFNVTAIFSPEHGFRGTADAGEAVKSSSDPKTGVPILSLYNGKEKKPSDESMQRFDVLVVDIQDVGLRFYTYYITMCRLMDACAEHGREVVVLDRPNPNGHYVDGPVLDMKYKSDVGWLPIPVVHGMTLGELARMVNGEGWLPQGRQCKLTVVPCLNYTHNTLYRLPAAPSPNLPDMKAVYLYPSLCFFEGTPVSVGRGTDKPFQVYGHPGLKDCEYRFTPKSMPGAKNPPLRGQECRGVDLSTLPEEQLARQGLSMAYVIHAYRSLGMGKKFFRPFFDLLAGTDRIRLMIETGQPAARIEASWQDEVEQFKERRKPYLLYP